MKKFFYAVGLLVFFSAGAGSVLLVDLVRLRFTSANLNETKFGAEQERLGAVPLIPEKEQGKDANNYWNQQLAEEGKSANEDSAGDFLSYSFAKAVERAAPSVVNIYTSRVVSQQEDSSAFFFDSPFFKEFFENQFNPPERERVMRSLGSGVIINANGYIVTNYHVIEKADEILVDFPDEREVNAEVVGVDPETDLALLKTELVDLPTLNIGDTKKIRTGDVVLAIGNPYGLRQTVTQGIISAVGRSDVGVATFENFLQTDAAINPGNSGGALINTDGELIGINTAIYSRTGTSGGLGFAIPADLVTDIVEQLLTTGSVERGWMGVSLFSRTENGEQKVFIVGVFRGGPADQLDIRAGDQLVSLDGYFFENPGDIVNYISNKKPGDEVRISIRRNDNIIDLLMILASRPINPSREN